LTARGKIEEAGYFLSLFEDVSLDVLKHYISAFLGASRSIFDHMLEDYRIWFKLDDVKILSAKTFRQLAEERENEKALEFVKWYEERLSALRKNVNYGFLFKKRDHNIHRNSSKETRVVTWHGPFTFQAGSEATIPVTMPRNLGSPTQVEGKVTKDGKTDTFPVNVTVAVFFDEKPDISILDLCSALLNDAKLMVEDAEKRWGTISTHQEPKPSTYYSYHPP
jgi:hypothetical protein